MADITYCLNSDCPFTDCKKHFSKIVDADLEGKSYVVISNFGGVCRRYIGYLVEDECRSKSTKGEPQCE